MTPNAGTGSGLLAGIAGSTAGGVTMDRPERPTERRMAPAARRARQARRARMRPAMRLGLDQDRQSRRHGAADVPASRDGDGRLARAGRNRWR